MQDQNNDDVAPVVNLYLKFYFEFLKQLRNPEEALRHTRVMMEAELEAVTRATLNDEGGEESRRNGGDNSGGGMFFFPRGLF